MRLDRPPSVAFKCIRCFFRSYKVILSGLIMLQAKEVKKHWSRCNILSCFNENCWSKGAKRLLRQSAVICRATSSWKYLWHCWDLLAPLAVLRRPNIDSAQGELCPLALPRYDPDPASINSCAKRWGFTRHLRGVFSADDVWQCRSKRRFALSHGSDW